MTNIIEEILKTKNSDLFSKNAVCIMLFYAAFFVVCPAGDIINRYIIKIS